MAKEKYCSFNSEEDYQSFRKELVEKSKEDLLSSEFIDKTAAKFGDLEKSLDPNETEKIKSLDKEKTDLRNDIISKMNDAYLNRKNIDIDKFYSPERFVIAADYFLEYLIEGKYLNLKSEKTEKVDFSEDVIIENSIRALLYYVEHPFTFITKQKDKKKNEIGKKLIEKFEKSNINTENSKNFSRACYILAGQQGHNKMILAYDNQERIDSIKIEIINFAKNSA